MSLPIKTRKHAKTHCCAVTVFKKIENFVDLSQTGPTKKVPRIDRIKSGRLRK